MTPRKLMLISAAMCVVGVIAAVLGVPWLLTKQRGRSLIVNVLGRPTIPFYATEPLSGVWDGLDQQRTQLPVSLVKVADGIGGATDVQFVPGSSEVLIASRRSGRCEWIDLKRQTRGLLFELVVPELGELGLLGLAFHPRFADNGRLYVHYNTVRDGRFDTHVSEWSVQRDADGALRSASEVRSLLEVQQPYDNHNGGQIAFGPDGFLYIGLGDGGHGGDPHGAGQDLTTWLGKILRIDVDGVDGKDAGDGNRPYRVPADNPFVGHATARPEIWVYGVRNPWRFSFDPQGRLVVADVGQDLWEELSFAERGDNLGWNQREADTCYKAPADGSNCASAQMREPFYVYGRDDGQSVTGGFVYTGDAVPELRGKYLFGDVIRGRLWAVPLPASTSERVSDKDVLALGRYTLMPTTFARDARGEVYVADFGHGSIYRVAQATSANNPTSGATP